MREEVFRGQDASGAHRSGSEGAAVAILGYAAAAYAAYLAAPSVLTGFALGAHARLLSKPCLHWCTLAPLTAAHTAQLVKLVGILRPRLVLVLCYVTSVSSPHLGYEVETG